MHSFFMKILLELKNASYSDKSNILKAFDKLLKSRGKIKNKKSLKKVLTLNVKADIIILVLERGQENKK